MRIAVSSDGPDLKSKVGKMFGTSKYFIIVDHETMTFESVVNPGASSLRGAGVQGVILVISKDVDLVLTGYCSPNVTAHLLKNGIKIFSGFEGNIKEAVEKYKKDELKIYAEIGDKPGSGSNSINRIALFHALKNSTRQFAGILPILAGVVLLIGLFNTFVSKKLLSFVFSGNSFLDALYGACLGSIFAGNPINSYIIGGELIEQGVGLFAVTAIIIAWVTVGILQMPAEIAALGRRFTLGRNITSFVFSIFIALLTVWVLNFFNG